MKNEDVQTSQDVHEDIQLVHRCLAKDQAAYTILMRKYEQSVYKMALRSVDDHHIAEELKQDAFHKAFHYLSKLKDPSRFAGWVHRIGKRCCIDWHRKRRVEMETLESCSPEIADLSEEHYLNEQHKQADRDLVRDLLKQLPKEERQTVILHYFYGYTCEEIGELLNISPNTAKSHLHRARERLKKVGLPKGVKYI